MSTPTDPLDRILPRREGAAKLRALRRQLSQSWSLADVESAFYSAGGLPAWASEFFAKHNPTPPRDWRRLVPGGGGAQTAV